MNEEDKLELLEDATTKPGRNGRTPGDRLAARLIRRANGCLEWTGATYPYGYGCIAVAGKTTATHRLAWELESGRRIPEGVCVLHSCDNPPCCEPSHLRVGTKLENNMDAVLRGRWSSGPRKTHCPQGHEYNEANTYIEPTGARKCRACHRARSNAAYQKRISV